MNNGDQVQESGEQSVRLVVPWLAVLLLAGLASSVYLTILYVRVEGGLQPEVDSFCVLNERVNCVTVACCRYSVLFGIPISVYGIQFYLLLLALLLCSSISSFPLRRWESYLFIFSGMSLPVCAVLAYLSFFVINSVCPLCCLVYAVNLMVFVTLGVRHRWSTEQLVVAGVRELLAAAQTRGRILITVGVLLAVSQFVWMPSLFAFDSPQNGETAGHSTTGRSRGVVTAPVHIEEFTDYQCPYCYRAHVVMEQLFEKYPQHIYYTVRYYPLDNGCNPHIEKPFHPQACMAAKYAWCAAEQGFFHAYQEQVWTHRRESSEELLQGFAAQVELDQQRFDDCLSSPRPAEKIREDIEEADRRGGIRGTPTFWIGEERIVGLRPLQFWERKVERLIGEKPADSNLPEPQP